MPRKRTFDKATIHDAAVALVRSEGWDALTARALAVRLGCSVAPIYCAFDSMETLKRSILEESARLLRVCAGRPYSDGPYLNAGVGFTVFARDEPQLFLALYRNHVPGGPFDEFLLSVRAVMEADKRLKGMPSAALDKIFDRVWTYTLGLALSLVFGQAIERDTEALARNLRSMGSVIMYGVLSGVDEYGGKAAREAWRRLIGEGALDVPMEKIKLKSEE